MRAHGAPDSQTALLFARGSFAALAPESSMHKRAPPDEPVRDGKRPKKGILRVLAVFFAVYGAYCLWWAIQGWYWSGGLSAVMSMATAVGLWLGYRWSRYFVYLFAAMILVYFIWNIWALLQIGWPYPDRIKSVAAVVPGSLILMFAVGAGIYVFRTHRGG